MRKVCLFLAVVLAAAGGCYAFRPAQAERGAPGSNEFGYGAVLEMDGAYFGDALALATDLPLDWLAIRLPWSEYSDPGNSAAWQRLDQVMLFAQHEQMAVMLSLTSAPPAAMSEQGPDPAKTASFVTNLAARYPALQAVELFPNANTRSGWGKPPNPQAYLRMYRQVQAGLKAADQTVFLAAAGLKPVLATQSGQDMQDTDFLEALLSASKADPLEVISLDLADLSGDPLDNPTEGNPAVLRRYELVRRAMIDNGHQKSIIWITSFCPPSGKIQVPGSKVSQPLSEPSSWMFQAYSQLRSQLYIGAIFYRSLNPPALGNRNSSLISDEQEYHPFYRVFRDLIAQNAPEAADYQKGRPKDELLKKKQT